MLNLKLTSWFINVDFSLKYVLLGIFCLLFILVVFGFYYPLYPIYPTALLSLFNLPGSFQVATLITNLIPIITAIIDLLIILAIGYGFGKKILNLINAPGSSVGCQPADEDKNTPTNSRRYFTDIEQFIFAVAVGFGLLSLLVFGLGLAGHLRYPVLFALLILGILISYQELRYFLIDIWKNRPKTKRTRTNLAISIFILIVLCVAFCQPS